MQFLKTASFWPALVIITFLIGACGPAATTVEGGVPSVPKSDGIVNWPDCTPGIAQVVPAPANFPPSFPLPWGIHLFKTATLGAGTSSPQLQIVALAPMSVSEASSYLLSQLPRTGYRFGLSDAEPGEAEARIHGNGWIGSYMINNVPGCEGVSQWTVVMGQLPH